MMAKRTEPDSPLKATCHCGAVTIQVSGKPREINECQCTLCRRYGAAWAYYDPKEVIVSVKDNSITKPYVWGDREIEFHFCSDCGCVTHWKSIQAHNEMGVNTRMMDPEDIKTVNRKIDFDALSTPLKMKETAHVQDQASY